MSIKQNIELQIKGSLKIIFKRITSEFRTNNCLTFNLKILHFIYLQGKCDSAGFKNLEQLYQIMEAQMNSLESHLGSIIKCLSAIEDGLGEGQKAHQKFIRQKKERAANHLMDKADELIKACNKYLALTDRNRDSAKEFGTNDKKYN